MLTISECPGDLELISWSPGSAAAATETRLQEALSRIRGRLQETGSVLLHERIYGDVAYADRILEIRDQVWHGEAEVPATYVEGKPCWGSGIAGLHAIAVRGAAGGESYVDSEGQHCGRLVEGADARYLYLWDLSRPATGQSPLSPEEDTQAALEIAESTLEDLGWSFDDVIRTWFYLRDILDWYDDFNRVRNDAYRRLRILGSGGDRMIPASTGIYGVNARGNWCTLDLLAMQPRDGRPFEVKRLTNPKQNEAPEYGSAFSRGLAVDTARCRYVLVSGTASIDDSGESVHFGSFEKQMERTLDTVGSLLLAGGVDMAHICQATAFVKRPQDVSTYHEILKRRGLQDMPAICTLADVCREELLFELDATAVLPDESVAGSSENG